MATPRRAGGSESRHPAEMGAPEVTRFLTSLAVNGRVTASTQNQALSALLFLYKDVLELDLPWLDGIVRARRPERLPVVLTREEVRAARHLERVRGQHRRDLQHGAGWVELPTALARKYPNAGREWAWQWVFPATRTYVDRLTGHRRRHHLHESDSSGTAT